MESSWTQQTLRDGASVGAPRGRDDRRRASSSALGRSATRWTPCACQAARAKRRGACSALSLHLPVRDPSLRSGGKRLVRARPRRWMFLPTIAWVSRSTVSSTGLAAGAVQGDVRLLAPAIAAAIESKSAVSKLDDEQRRGAGASALKPSKRDHRETPSAPAPPCRRSACHSASRGEAIEWCRASIAPPRRQLLGVADAPSRAPCSPSGRGLVEPSWLFETEGTHRNCPRARWRGAVRPLAGVSVDVGRMSRGVRVPTLSVFRRL